MTAAVPPPPPPAAWPCTGPGCSGKGSRVPAGLTRRIFACRRCDGPHLFDPNTQPKKPRSS